jgi:hypothetical protein
MVGKSRQRAFYGWVGPMQSQKGSFVRKRKAPDVKPSALPILTAFLTRAEALEYRVGDYYAPRGLPPFTDAFRFLKWWLMVGILVIAAIVSVVRFSDDLPNQWRCEACAREFHTLQIEPSLWEHPGKGPFWCEPCSARIPLSRAMRIGPVDTEAK